jgi:hypothetical protein
MLAFVDLISCITNKGEESTQFMFPGGVLGEMHLFRGACIHAFGSSFSPEL